MGTAAPAGRWLLVEHPGPWAVDAWAGSGVADAVRGELDAAARAARARILLIRRPGRRPREAGRAWAVAGRRGSEREVTWGVWETGRDLLDAVPALSGEPSPSSERAVQPPETLLLVCAHGRHDTCCAVRGRPVAAALQRAWPRQTWECSHVGGDRFAANLVVLPDGVYYGNLDADSAVTVVRGHLDGRVDVDHLRGLSSEGPVAQVAVAAAHRHHGPAGPDAFASTDVRQLSEHRWQVWLRGEPPCPPSLLVTVETSARQPARLTCRAARATAAVAYEVVDLRRLPE